MKNVLICFALLMLSQVAYANGVDINLNNESARIMFITGSDRRAETEIGYLFNEDDFNIPHIGLHIVDTTGSQSKMLKMSLGGRAYAVLNDPIKVFAIGLGGAFIYTPGIAYDRLHIHLGAHYSPQVITFEDGDQMLEFEASLEYQVLTRGFIYFGYRKVEVDFGNTGKQDVDEGGHAGLKIVF